MKSSSCLDILFRLWGVQLPPPLHDDDGINDVFLQYIMWVSTQVVKATILTLTQERANCESALEGVYHLPLVCHAIM